MEELVGHIAGFLTTVSFVPQVVKVFRSKNNESISLVMYLVFSVGVLLWLFYGIAKDSWPMIIFNAITLVLALIILFVKIKENSKKSKV